MYSIIASTQNFGDGLMAGCISGERDERWIECWTVSSEYGLHWPAGWLAGLLLAQSSAYLSHRKWHLLLVCSFCIDHKMQTIHVINVLRDSAIVCVSYLMAHGFENRIWGHLTRRRRRLKSALDSVTCSATEQQKQYIRCRN